MSKHRYICELCGEEFDSVECPHCKQRADSTVCGKKYFCEIIRGTTWCTAEFPCPQCDLSQKNTKEVRHSSH